MTTYRETLQDLGAQFERERKKRGWDCAQASAELGISTRQLYRLERGICFPHPRTMNRILGVYERKLTFKLKHRGGE